MNLTALSEQSAKQFFSKLWQRVFLIAVTVLPFLNGCEQTVSNPQLPYVEKLVIMASLHKNYAEAYISKTLPLTQKYSNEAAMVRDARVTLTLPDGSQEVMTINPSNYYTINTINTPIGGTYILRVEWKGLVATATTTLPPDPMWEVDSVEMIDTTQFHENPDYPYYSKGRAIITLKTTSQPNLLYKARCVSYTSSDTSDSNAISSIMFATLGKNVTKLEDWYPKIYISGETPIRAVLISLNSSTTALDDFYSSSRDIGNHGGGSIFGSFGTNPKFNVKGDGIGVFDGYAYGSKEVLVRLE